MELHSLVTHLRNSTSLKRKKAIHPPIKAFSDLWNFGSTVDPIGDDAAIIKMNDSYLLFSCDGILPQLVKEEPYWAGYCAVLVSVSDIYAMGGRPLAVVNLLSAPDEENSMTIAKGMAEGCRKLGVPMVGGHFLPDEPSGVATAIIGKASHLLRATEGSPGQSLIAAIDLVGSRYKHYPQWNSTSDLSPDVMQKKLEVLPSLAEAGMVTAARDISNAGILGTIAMLAENSKCGANINLEKIPMPSSVEMKDWLEFYPGYGFILSVNKADEEEVISQFEQEGISASVIGNLTESLKVAVSYGDEEIVYMDFNSESLVLG
ncbi:sll0787 family AIR synthase-like protein [Neobacillus sp. 179-J 1A1 HS]|uniref:sll0787 family AIR synthase-like protein n=1 Tax=Neobacillus driksii TaxID=3035913 RepID=UPI0035BC44A7